MGHTGYPTVRGIGPVDTGPLGVKYLRPYVAPNLRSVVEWSMGRYSTGGTDLSRPLWARENLGSGVTRGVPSLGLGSPQTHSPGPVSVTSPSLSDVSCLPRRWGGRSLEEG